MIEKCQYDNVVHTTFIQAWKDECSETFTLEDFGRHHEFLSEFFERLYQNLELTELFMKSPKEYHQKIVEMKEKEMQHQKKVLELSNRKANKKPIKKK